MADMTVQNSPGAAVAAPMGGPRLPAGRAAVADEVAANNAAPPERELTGMEKLALVREARAKQAKMWPCCVPLIRQVRQEQAAHAEAKAGPFPLRPAAARDGRPSRRQ